MTRIRKIFARVLCAILGHTLIVIHSCSKQAQHVYCPHCDQHFGIHHGVHAFIRWSPDLCICDDIDALIEKERTK